MRGHEWKHSLNHGKFIEHMELLASYSSYVTKVVLEKAPKYASYVYLWYPKRDFACSRGESKKSILWCDWWLKFYIIINEARDISNQE